jgi:hypothetical protein
MDSKRIAGIVLLCAACLVGFLISTAYYSIQEEDRVPYWWKGLRLTGVITNVTPESISIKIETGEIKKFSIDSLTKINLMGNIGLQKGNIVRITYKNINSPEGIGIARWIREIPESAPSPSGTVSTSPGTEPAASVTPTPAGSETPTTGKASASPPAAKESTAPGEKGEKKDPLHI